MEHQVPERNKVPGLSYAFSAEGLELPVIDVTHPAFSAATPEALRELAERSLPRIRKSARLPEPVIAFMARRSIIVRGALAAKGGFVSGMTTYLMKLGPENLGRGYAGWIDRRMATAVSPACMRRRLRDVVRVLADAVALELIDQRRPLVLLNLAGGTAIDSLNVLLVLRRQHPDLLDGRAISVRVLDLDEAAPTFGARALEALCRPGAALQGVKAAFELRRHDWSDLEGLRRQLADLDQNAVVGISSEGGLFEYGSDEVILGNLGVVREATPKGSVVVGSYMRDTAVVRALSQNTGATNRWFEDAAFDALVERGGWRVAQRAGGNPMYEVVRLARG